MPMTLPTHPVAVVGLKLWRPAWFDGVALVVGAMAPDLAYGLDGYGITIHSHAWHAPLWWALPVTLVLAPLIRWAAPAVAAHLPAGGPFALRDYGVLGRVRHPILVTATSAVLGAVSHIVWDAFAHPTVDGRRVWWPALQHEALLGRPWWQVIANVSDAIGFLGAAFFLWYVGRKRLLRRWHGEPPVTAARPVRFWTVVGVVVLAGAALLPLQPVSYVHDQIVRLIVIVGAALLAGTLVLSDRLRPQLPGRRADRGSQERTSRR